MAPAADSKSALVAMDAQATVKKQGDRVSEVEIAALEQRAQENVEKAVKVVTTERPASRRHPCQGTPLAPCPWKVIASTYNRGQ